MSADETVVNIGGDVTITYGRNVDGFLVERGGYEIGRTAILEALGDEAVELGMLELTLREVFAAGRAAEREMAERELAETRNRLAKAIAALRRVGAGFDNDECLCSTGSDDDGLDHAEWCGDYVRAYVAMTIDDLERKS